VLFQKKYKFKGEVIRKEPWQWFADYSDGTFLQQFDDESGTFHQTVEIDRARLKRFGLYREGKPKIWFDFDPGTMEIVCYTLNTVLEAFTPNERRTRRYVFGYRKNGDKRLVMIDEDDSIKILEREE
jgi:hypothetical protein